MWAPAPPIASAFTATAMLLLLLLLSLWLIAAAVLEQRVAPLAAAVVVVAVVRAVAPRCCYALPAALKANVIHVLHGRSGEEQARENNLATWAVQPPESEGPVLALRRHAKQLASMRPALSLPSPSHLHHHHCIHADEVLGSEYNGGQLVALQQGAEQVERVTLRRRGGCRWC